MSPRAERSPAPGAGTGREPETARTGAGPALVLLAAGRSSRFGRPKQLEPLGPGGASLTAYTVFDALRAGFRRVVLVIRPPLRDPLRAHLEEQLGPGLPLKWVIQSTDDLPEAHRPLARGREKPWGTGQAVLACRAQLPGPFGIANADDWYGPEALAALAGGLRALPDAPPCPGLLVGFPLSATLPPSGAGVSRGWVRHRDGLVDGVVELRDTARLSHDPGAGIPRVAGTAPDGERIVVAESVWASMNLWGFGSCALPLLASAFEEFLDREGTRPGAEFALSTAADTLVTEGSLALRLLPDGRRWFGITHPEDAVWVRERLQALHADGTYPDRLRDAVPDLLARLAP